MYIRHGCQISNFMLKYFVIILFCFQVCLSMAQSSDAENFWGTYFASHDKGMLLNICDNEEWFFTNSVAASIDTSDKEYHQKCSPQDVFGLYEVRGDTLAMSDHSGGLFFLIQVVDSMNLKVLYANDFLEVGDFMNRRSSYFKGHDCRSLFDIDLFARWAVFELKNGHSAEYEILKFQKPGFIFENENYEVGKLTKGIYMTK